MSDNKSQLLKGLTSYWSDRAHSYSTQNLEELNDWRRLAWRELILSHAPKKTRLRVLDIGTGPGFFAINLALAGHDVTAVDVTEHMLWHAERNAHAYCAPVKFVLNDGDSLPFGSSTFDLVVSRNVLWNLEHPKDALCEWSRVLSSGGRMVYFDANWYLYLYDDNLRSEREKARLAFCTNHPEASKKTWDLGPKRSSELEQMARSLPLSKEYRPQWDKHALEELGLHVIEIKECIGKTVQDPLEYERDLLNPMFMICAEKL